MNTRIHAMIRVQTVFAALLIATPQLACAVSPTPAEMAESRRWATAAFEGVQVAVPVTAGLQVLANNDPIQRNNRNGNPMRIVDLQYPRGLFCHAMSKVLVRLPGPGKTFTAVVGVDSNDQTKPGRGSVVFSVVAGDKSVFQSKLMREGMPGEVVQANLAGATEFTLNVGDGGDGIGCDQADWADAKVVLADGKTVWLGDLPILGVDCAYRPEPFFSFTYGGKPSAELLKTWKLDRTKRELDANRMEHTLTYTDPKTGLVVRCVGIEYKDFPTVEWTLYFKNTGDKDTPILSDIRSLDFLMERQPAASSAASQEFRLHHHVGSICAPNDYQPLETVLTPGTDKRIAGAGGRPTNSDLSYFNVELPNAEGVIVVVGWSGQWAANFTRDQGNQLHILAGQELTHFKLLPGEEVRTPMSVLLFWKGDRIRAQNVWRRWMMAHSMPKPGGKLPPPQMAGCSSRAYNEMIDANEQNQIMFIDRYLEEKLKIDYWWMDAGWYIQNQGWPQVGTWEVDPKRFPKGLRPISDHAHANGVKIVVWFEPERVAAGTWLADNHPEWILGGKNGGLLNLGNPDAWKWLVEHVDKLITEQGIDLYRQDFNMDPLSYWRANDAPDRQGITEIKHVTGYLAYWDELLRRHPNMLIDCCASGGRRNDLETLRRAVPLWRSDFPFEPNSQQCQTYGLSFWVPYHGTGTVASSAAGYYGGGKSPVEPYAFWSNSAPGLNIGIDMRVKDIDYPALRRLFEQREKTAPYYYGDFYPLTSYSLDSQQWMAWQFACPEKGEGMIQAFRRKDSPYESIRVRLRGLDPSAVYSLTDVDGRSVANLSGSELMEKGLAVSIENQPGVAVIVYKKKS